MSPPDPVQPPAPVDPDADEPPKRLFGFAFWAAIVFAIACICAGAVIWRLGPQLFPVHAPAAPSSMRGP